jgi:CO dehydrogenase/acetyl-CoA synthase epsilon subunit
MNFGVIISAKQQVRTRKYPHATYDTVIALSFPTTTSSQVLTTRPNFADVKRVSIKVATREAPFETHSFPRILSVRPSCLAIPD